MRVYFAVFRMKFIAGLQYRAAAWAGIATQLFFGFMYLMIYDAFYRSNPAAAPMDFSALASYIWLQQSFILLVNLWKQDNDLLSSIQTGGAAYELARPCAVYPVWWARLLAMRLSGAALRFVPVMLITVLLHAPWALSAPASLEAGVLFAVAMLLGACINVTISMFVYIFTFVMLSPTGAKLLVTAAADFLAGMLVPVPMMPLWLQRVVYCFPFHYMADFPFRVYSAQLGTADALGGIAVQLCWLAFLVPLGAWAMSRVLRRAVLQGG